MEAMEMKEIEAAVEGILFASGEPVAADRIAVALDLERDFSLRVQEADGTVRTLSSGEVRVKPAQP